MDTQAAVLFSLLQSNLESHTNKKISFSYL